MLGNATAGIALTLQAAGISGKRVAIPNNVCINVPMGVYFSGNQPLFLDICKDDFGLDPDLLATSIDRIDVVIAVHAYGIPCKIKQIESICKQNGVFLIEDLAVAQGATISGEAVGRFGDASIVSFGNGKIIDIGHGGAVLTNNRTLTKKLKELMHGFPACSSASKDKIDQFSSYHTKLYNQSYGSDLNESANHFKTGALALQSNYFYQFDTSYTQKIMSELNDLAVNVEQRLTRNQQIIDQFVDIPPSLISTIKLPDGSVPWRTNILVNKRRDQVLRSLIDSQYKISSWQPSVDLFFEDRCKVVVDTPVSDWLGDVILNLWSNQDADDKYIYKITSEIKKMIR
jgi:dTDP-4-amino-4,6-dideoxygalactose transaminase